MTLITYVARNSIWLTGEWCTYVCVFKYSQYCILMASPTPSNVWRRWVMHVGNAIVPCTLNSDRAPYTVYCVVCVVAVNPWHVVLT